MKPHPRIFHTLLDRYELAPDDCTFIDDNPDNVEGAKKLGIHGILFQGAEPLRKELGLI